MNAGVALIESLMQRYLGSGVFGTWKYELRDYMWYRALGKCSFRRKCLVFNKYYVEHASLDDVRETVLHEIAHALTGPYHDEIFKRVALAIGGSGAEERAFAPKSLDVIANLPTKYIIRCPRCKWEIKRNRFRKGDVCRTCLGPPEVIRTRNR